MKKSILTIILLSFICIGIHAQSAKIVIDQNGYECEYVGENKTQYEVCIQDVGWIPKKGARVKTIYAAKGQGYLIPLTPGPKFVYLQPSFKSRKIARIGYYEGNVPMPYACKGVTKGWFKIRTTFGKIGYVPKRLFEWRPIPVG